MKGTFNSLYEIQKVKIDIDWTHYWLSILFMRFGPGPNPGPTEEDDFQFSL